MAEAGSNGRISTTTLFSKILLPFVDKAFSPFTPDYFLDKLSDLSHFGMNARIWQTPGHSKGSVSIEFENGELKLRSDAFEQKGDLRLESIEYRGKKIIAKRMFVQG